MFPKYVSKEIQQKTLFHSSYLINVTSNVNKHCPTKIHAVIGIFNNHNFTFPKNKNSENMTKTMF